MATAKKKKKKKVAKKTSKPAAASAKVSARSSVKKTASKTDWKKLIHPLQDRLVAIEVDTPNTTTPSGLILPVENEAFKHARVVAAGLGRVTKKGKLRPLDVQVGDMILITPHVGTKVTVESQEAIIVREEDVLGIVSTPSL